MTDERGRIRHIAIRGTSTDLPLFPEEMELAQVSSLDSAGGPLSRFDWSNASMRALDIKDVKLLEGRINSVRAETVSVKRVNVQSVEFTHCDLSSLRWTGGKISKTWFNDCKLLGARFDGTILENLAFTDCKLDYSILSHIRSSGPVMFIRCSFREAEFDGCDFAHSLFEECDLTLVNFGHGKYIGCDLRGNDLSAVNGAHNLKGVVLNYSQLTELAEALATELDITFGNEGS